MCLSNVCECFFCGAVNQKILSSSVECSSLGHQCIELFSYPLVHRTLPSSISAYNSSLIHQCIQLFPQTIITHNSFIKQTHNTQIHIFIK